MDSLKHKFTATMSAAIKYQVPIDLAYALWWTDARPDSAGLGLSSTGRKIMKRTSIPCFPVTLPMDFLITPKISLGLGKCLACPYFLSTWVTQKTPHKFIELFGEQEAIFLILLDGDLNKFIDQMETRIII